MLVRRVVLEAEVGELVVRELQELPGVRAILQVHHLHRVITAALVGIKAVLTVVVVAEVPVQQVATLQIISAEMVVLGRRLLFLAHLLLMLVAVEVVHMVVR